MIRAGELTHRLEIQQATETQNDHGETVETWATVAERWGSVEPLSGRELMEAQQVRPEITHRVRLRYYEGLTSSHRFKHGTRVYHIQSLLDMGLRGVEHVTHCIERPDA